MFVIEIDQETASAMVAEIASHLPRGQSLGTIKVASPAGVLVDHGGSAGMYALDDDGRGAWRQLEVGSSGWREITTWANGEETGRRMVRDTGHADSSSDS